MAIISNTEKFIEKSKSIHGEKYNYSLVNYTNNRTKVNIICEKHGIFQQKPNDHLLGKNCYKCSLENKPKKEINYFIDKAKSIHGDRYDYLLINNVDENYKVEIICKEHGIFKQNIHNHINGQNCPKCAKFINLNIGTDLLTKKFIKNAKLIHDDKYDYSLVKYTKSNEKIKIICKEHGVFEQTPNNHLQKCGCIKCGYIENGINGRNNNFIEDAIKIHGNKYDYSMVEYNGNKNKIEIICKKHGIFKQKPCDHLQGIGCPKCNNSRGVNKICRILENKNIGYLMEQTIENCVSPKNYPLKFDIYIPETNIYIEFDGIQHFEYKEKWGGETVFLYRKTCDKIKDDFCLSNNIPLYRISYKDNIEEEINKILNN